MYQELKNYTSADLIIINNPIDTAAVYEMAYNPVNAELYKVNTDKINLVFIGRLTFQKGIDLLVEFASKLNENCLLHIVGGGELDEWLETKLKELDLGARVIMHGTLNNPFPLLVKANFMIMSSRYEGFPNVALESLSLGVPIVAMPFSGGGKEIFTPRRNSVLARGITGESLFNAYEDAAGIEFNSDYIKKSTFEKFDVSVISAIYRQELF
jgi:glycosyltransferase involved in cell wall biosynthesis